MWKNKETGEVYDGDCRVGDSEATEGELDSHNAQKEATAKAQVISDAKLIRKDIFSALAGLQSEALTNGDQETAEAIVVAQAGLRDLPQNAAVLQAQGARATQIAILSVYSGIVNYLKDNAPQVVSAFNVVKP